MANIAASRRYNRYEPKKYKIDEIIICSGLEKENVSRKITPLQPPPPGKLPTTFLFPFPDHPYLLADGARTRGGHLVLILGLPQFRWPGRSGRIQTRLLNEISTYSSRVS